MIRLQSDVDYVNLSLADVSAALGDVARQSEPTFAGLDGRQLNWRPDATRWSVAQCLEHLLTANRLMIQAAEDALTGATPRTIWQRLPVWPGVAGKMLIRSQAPGTTRKFSAAPAAQPAASDITDDIVPRFLRQHREAAAWVQRMDQDRAAGRIMTSPFVRVVTYSVLDGCRLIVAHDHRHLQQARHVTRASGFPTG